MPSPAPPSTTRVPFAPTIACTISWSGGTARGGGVGRAPPPRAGEGGGDAPAGELVVAEVAGHRHGAVHARRVDVDRRGAAVVAGLVGDADALQAPPRVERREHERVALEGRGEADLGRARAAVDGFGGGGVG